MKSMLALSVLLVSGLASANVPPPPRTVSWMEVDAVQKAAFEEASLSDQLVSLYKSFNIEGEDGQRRPFYVVEFSNGRGGCEGRMYELEYKSIPSPIPVGRYEVIAHRVPTKKPIECKNFE